MKCELRMCDNKKSWLEDIKPGENPALRMIPRPDEEHPQDLAKDAEFEIKFDEGKDEYLCENCKNWRVNESQLGKRIKKVEKL